MLFPDRQQEHGVRLLDDAFAKVCDGGNDPSKAVRAEVRFDWLECAGNDIVLYWFGMICGICS